MRKLVWVAVVMAAWGGVSAAQTAPAAAAIRTTAVPAMWTVKGTHGTVYLFGSVHVMKPGVEWETAKVKEAFRASDVLYLEVANLDPEGVKAMQPMLMKLGMDAEHPLSTKVSKEDVELLNGAAKSLGTAMKLPSGELGEQMFEVEKPWLVYLTLSVLPALEAGYDAQSGIDQVLLAEAKTQNKRVLGFETAEEQLHFLADFPEAQQVELLHQTLVDLPKSAGQMDAMVADWTRGDVEKIAAMENDELKTKSPGLYQKLLVTRNEHFAEVLAGVLKNPATGTVFVTIGAAHLAGPDSVLKMLEKKGFAAVRVE